MNEKWVVCVDDMTFGFFDTEQLAYQWLRKEFPILSKQGCYEVTQFQLVSN